MAYSLSYITAQTITGIRQLRLKLIIVEGWVVYYFCSTMYISSTVSETLSCISQNLKRSRDSEHTHFRANLSRICHRQSAYQIWSA